VELGQLCRIAGDRDLPAHTLSKSCMAYVYTCTYQGLDQGEVGETTWVRDRRKLYPWVCVS
jgi:hypothetical protein